MDLNQFKPQSLAVSRVTFSQIIIGKVEAFKDANVKISNSGLSFDTYTSGLWTEEEMIQCKIDEAFCGQCDNWSQVKALNCHQLSMPCYPNCGQDKFYRIRKGLTGFRMGIIKPGKNVYFGGRQAYLKLIFEIVINGNKILFGLLKEGKTKWAGEWGIENLSTGKQYGPFKAGEITIKCLPHKTKHYSQRVKKYKDPQHYISTIGKRIQNKEQEIEKIKSEGGDASKLEKTLAMLLRIAGKPQCKPAFETNKDETTSSSSKDRTLRLAEAQGNKI